MQRILIIEDEVIISRYIKESLESIDYSIKVGNSVQEAKKIFNEFSPQLVILDIDLEDSINGIELASFFLQLNNNLGIIFLTSDSSPSTLKQVNKINYLNYILKPIDEKQLQTSVHLALEKLQAKNTQFQSLNDDLKKLTKSELKIIKLLANQLSTKEVAKQLFVSTKTIENHRYNIGKKLNLEPKKNSLLVFITSNSDRIKSIDF